MRCRKKVLVRASVALVVLLSIAAYVSYPYCTVVTSLVAHTVCAGTFISGLDEQRIRDEDLADVLKFPVRYKIDRTNRSVVAFLPGGIARREAVFRQGLGVTLASGITVEQLLAQKFSLPAIQPVNPDQMPWPAGDKDAAAADLRGVDVVGLERAVNAAFLESDPDHPARTRAVVVVYKGRIVAERYATGITRDTPLIGWSMAKSLTSALTGIWLHRNDLKVSDKPAVHEWGEADDPRRRITFSHLLQMNSGLDYVQKPTFPQIRDEYREVMLEFNAGRYAANRQLKDKPGTRFYYMNGSANLLMRLMKEQLGEPYHAFPRLALFNRLGMRTVVFAPDASGGFIGSSFAWACARDWARFGLLYLNDGFANGERVLPEGWVTYSRTPVATAPEKGGYGALFWLNTPDGSDHNLAWPGLPKDAFSCQGSEGQITAILPSKQLVVVRLGMTKGKLGAKFDRALFVTEVAKAFPKE